VVRGGEGRGWERSGGRGGRSGKGRERENGRGEKGKRGGREEGRGWSGKGRAGGAFRQIKIYDYTPDGGQGGQPLRMAGWVN